MKTEELQVWRTEIAAELEIANADLAVAVEAVTAAQTARDEANAKRRRAAEALRSLSDPEQNPGFFGQPRPALPAALTRRLGPAERAAHQAEGTVSFSKEVAVNAQRVVDGLKDALERLDRALVPAEAEAVAE